jgi:hypothetical protein
MNMNTHFVLSLLAPMLLIGATGCGGPAYEVAPVQGTITHNGQPVKGGSITFRPLSVEGAEEGELAKPAAAQVADDGTFVLSTHGSGDGAAVGTHQVLFTPHMEGAKSYDDKPEESPYVGLIPEPREVKVVSDDNTINIKLVERVKR